MKPLSERDSNILAQHAGGASFKEIAAALNVSPVTARRVVEQVGPIHAKGRELLAADPESLEGLRMTGTISQRAYSAIANATYEIDVPDMERLSEVAAQGRECVACFPRCGGRASKTMAELDTLLAKFGLTWNPRPRPFAWRTDENRHPFMQAMADDRKRAEQQAENDRWWGSIVREVAELERTAGKGVLKDSAGRDSMKGVVCRLAFLNGYLEGRLERANERNMRDITPEPGDQADGEYETAGNLICLPGVKLADVQPSDGGRP